MTGLKETFAIDISNRIALTGPSIDTNTSFASHERNRLGDGGLWAESRLEKQKQAPIIVKGPVEISLLDPTPSRLLFFLPSHHRMWEILGERRFQPQKARGR